MESTFQTIKTIRKFEEGRCLNMYMAYEDEVDEYSFEFDEEYPDISRLYGKYIITCTSPKNSDILYYQDRSICKKGFWTQYISNAFAFHSATAAKAYRKRLRYNNPVVNYFNPKTHQLERIS